MDGRRAAGRTGVVERRRSPITERLSEHTLWSDALDAPVGLRLLVPPDLPSEPLLPVLYLLHGGDDDFRSWSDAGEVERLCEGLDLIVVMPDCGPGGWYTDWACADGPAGSQRWETHHLVELDRWLTTQLPIRTDRAGRAVAGLSMGGFGAMKYAARHPDRFCFAAAFSGAVDIVDPHLGLFADAMAGLNGGRPGDIWGDRDRELHRWRAHNPVDLAGNLDGIELQLRTGNGQAGGVHGGEPDLIETTVHRTTSALHQRLVDMGMDHVWDDYGPGVHTWPYWVDALERTLPAVMAATERTAPDRTPDAFEHLAHDQAFEVWGWNVRLGAGVTAAPTLLRTDHNGFSLQASSFAVVSTPARFAPAHATVHAVVDDEERAVQADQDGRLHLELNEPSSGVSQVLLDRPTRPTG